MKKLKFKPEITIKIPNTIKEIKDKTYMKIKVRELLNNNINSYWRENINPDCKYIGISSTMIDKNFACFLIIFYVELLFLHITLIFIFIILY